MKIINSLLTPNQWSRPQKKLSKVKAIVIHWVANTNSTAMANRNFFERRKFGNLKYGSAHEIIDLNGDVVICVPDDEVTYNCGSKTYTQKCLDTLGGLPNYCTYAIECTHIDDDGLMTKETYNSLVNRCVELCKKWNLNPLKDLWLHQEVVGWKSCHHWFVCNPKEWENFKNKVNSLINKETEKIMDLDEALKILVEYKVINSLDYWKKVVSIVKYFDVFIINVANKIKELKG